LGKALLLDRAVTATIESRPFPSNDAARGSISLTLERYLVVDLEAIDFHAPHDPAAGLLHNVRELVGQEVAASLGTWSVLPRLKHDFPAGRVCERTD
jgi:hypothetical protein